jgi:hypothetical protein
MWTFKTGDLIAKIHPLIEKPLQVGLVINHDVNTFLIKWTSFNKEFFMEKEEEIFMELNKTFLLGTVQVHRMNLEANLSLLNSNYNNDKRNRHNRTP